MTIDISFQKLEKYSDLTIKLKNRDIRAHSMVLSVRTEYFARALYEDQSFAEARAKQIDLSNGPFNDEELIAVLNYCYDEFEKVDVESWVGAGKCLQGLIDCAEYFMVSKMVKMVRRTSIKSEMITETLKFELGQAKGICAFDKYLLTNWDNTEDPLVQLCKKHIVDHDQAASDVSPMLGLAMLRLLNGFKNEKKVSKALCDLYKSCVDISRENCDDGEPKLDTANESESKVGDCNVNDQEYVQVENPINQEADGTGDVLVETNQKSDGEFDPKTAQTILESIVEHLSSKYFDFDAVSELITNYGADLSFAIPQLLSALHNQICSAKSTLRGEFASLYFQGITIIVRSSGRASTGVLIANTRNERVTVELQFTHKNNEVGYEKIDAYASSIKETTFARSFYLKAISIYKINGVEV